MCGRSDTKIAVDGAVRLEEGGDRADRLERRPALVLHQDRLGRHAALDGEGPSDGGLGRTVAGRLAAGHHEARRVAGQEERHPVIEAGGEDRRRAPVVLRCAHHHDRVGRALLVLLALRPDPVRRVPGGQGHAEAGGPDQPQQVPNHRRVRRRLSQTATPDPLGQRPWHFLYLAPEPHQHGSFRPILAPLGV